MQDVISRLTDNLAEERKAVNALLDVLQEEQDCLVAADISRLPQMTDEKARIASRLSGLAKQRYDALAEAGFDASEAGMEKWANSANATVAVRDAWNELLSVARDGKERNRINGLMIQQQMSRNQNALHVLFAHAQGGNFYGPDGQATAKVGGRRLGAG